MRPWKKSLLTLLLVGVITGFGFRAPLAGDTHMASLDSAQAPGEWTTLPFISSTLDQIERTNELPKVISQGPTLMPLNIPLPAARPDNLSSDASATAAGVNSSAGADCAACTTRLANLKFAQCTRRNDYLEKSLQKAIQQNGLMADLMKTGARGDTIIKPICMQLGMESRFGANNTSFRTCDPQGLQASKKVFRPCISEDYFSLMNNSFDLVSRCMGPMLSAHQAERDEEVRLLFGMLHIESGLHLNAKSPSGAAGIGQLTQDAISSINRNEIQGIREKLEAQGGVCARLSREILAGKAPMNASFSRSCERVSIEKGNPLLNLVYSFANVMQGKRMINKDVIDYRRFKDRFKLPKSEQDRLEASLAIWTHNTGPAGLKVPLVALLNSTYRKSSVTNVDQFLTQLSWSMKRFPHSANRRSARRSETSNYYPFMQKVLKKLERDAGGGSCLVR